MANACRITDLAAREKWGERTPHDPHRPPLLNLTGHYKGKIERETE
jgi:hypothetical protein